MLQDVIDALRRHSPDAAALARAEVDAAPDDAQAHHLLAVALRLAGRYDDAHQSLDTALAIAPVSPDFHVTRAGLFLDAGRLDAALQEIDAAVALDPNQLMAYIMGAQIALARGDLPSAEHHAKRAALVNPDHPHVRAIQGQIAMRNGQPDAAIELLTRAVAAAPEDVLSLSSLAQAYLMRGSAAFAEQAFRRALEREPFQFGLSLGLIESLRRQDRRQEAREVLDSLRKALPDDPRLLQMHGEYAMQEESPDDALLAFRGVLEQRPDDARALAGAMQTWQKEEQQQHGRDVLDGLLKLHPRASGMWRARFALEEKRRQASIDVLERWLDALPDDADALEAMAQVREIEGRLDEAEALADRALRSGPALRLGAELVKARTLLHRDPESARQRLEYLVSVASDPRQKRALSGWLGYSADACGDYPRALGAWEAVHALQQDLPSLPALGDIDENLDRAAAAAAQARNDVIEPPPVLLWGPPGSGVERIASILKRQSELPFLDDRMRDTKRRDGFQTGIFSELLNPDREVEAAEAFNFYWRRGISELGYGDTSVIDWLRRWDARLAPAIRRAMPHSRLIAAIRDPRDMLLNWIAFGSPLGFAYPGALPAAKWLAMALEHLGWLSSHPLIDLCLVPMDGIDEDSESIAQNLQRFLRLENTPPTNLSDSHKGALGGHSTRLPPGHWRRYRDVLAEPFARLENISQRFGYPVD